MTRLIALALALAFAGPGSANPCFAAGACCKVCKAGKACGDSCIARDRVCKKGKGCACDG